MSAPRRWVRRAALSMLAGSGLTAAGFGGPLAGGALGAEVTSTTTTTPEDQSPPVTETTPQAPATGQEGSAGGAAGSGTGTTSTSGAPTGTSADGEAGSTSSTATTPTAPSTATTPATPPPAGEQETPTVVVQQSQQPTSGRRHGASVTGKGTANAEGAQEGAGESAKQQGPAEATAGGPNGIAPAPQTAGEEAGVLAALLSGSTVSAQALDFYRIPLFLLPVYQAAAFQYDVPWQILAAINEIETDYGTDLSVSTAGALGWMQFMPGTWLQYGVDATDAGYADPFNPVDSIFAAARYLHAADASHHLRAAIFAYNHSQEYVESVLLRAKLIASYPGSVVATLTGLVDGSAPTAGARLAPGEAAALSGSSSATAGAVPATPLAPPPAAAGAQASAGAPASSAQPPAANAATAHTAPTGPEAGSAAAVPGSKPAPSPRAAAARARALANAPAKRSQLVELLGAPGAPVVAVEDGRIERLGHSRALGRYLVLRDIYGDVFTYAGLGSIAPRYRPYVPRVHPAAFDGTAGAPNTGTQAGAPGTREPAHDPAPTAAASAGRQTPLTLKVKAHAATAPALATPAEPEGENVPAGMGRVRLFAHPRNPLARAAAHAANGAGAGGRWTPLRTGSIVAKGTVLGRLYTPPGASAGQLRFAVRPSGDGGTIDPQPLLENWHQLGASLHPKGSKDANALVGATAGAVLTMSKAALERVVLADPGIQLDACARRDVAAGVVDARVLASLAFLSRSGLQPTVGGLRCPATSSASKLTVIAGAADIAARQAAAHIRGLAVDITAINNIPIAGHQGPGTVADVAIRALLTLHGRLAPQRIVSLMRYPQAPATQARPTAWSHIHIEYAPLARVAVRAHTATAGPSAASPLAASGELSGAQWSRLIQRIGKLPKPTVSVLPSSSAIRDPQAAPTNRGLGARGLGPGN